MIICFSGTDGAGKSTQIERLSQRLAALNIEAQHIWSRGGYTPMFMALKRSIHILMGRRKNELVHDSGNANYSARRSKALRKPWVARFWLSLAILDLALLYGVYVRVLSLLGRTVILDRYMIDTRIDFLRHHSAFFSDRSPLWRVVCRVVPTPDVHFLLTVPVEVSLARSKEKNEPYPDSLETLEFRLAAYQEFAEANLECVVILDGREPLEVLFEKIDQHIPVLRTA
jgi:thymidylate kinase